jgi:hypothetical protein
MISRNHDSLLIARSRDSLLIARSRDSLLNSRNHDSFLISRSLRFFQFKLYMVSEKHHINLASGHYQLNMITP